MVARPRGVKHTFPVLGRFPPAAWALVGVPVLFGSRPHGYVSKFEDSNDRRGSMPSKEVLRPVLLFVKPSS